MGTRIRSVILILFIAALSVNYILYSSQRFVPPKAESKSYSVMNCPSHEGGSSMTKIVEFIFDSQEQKGSEKMCFCYSCCKDRVPPTLSGTGILAILSNDYNYLGELYEPGLSDDSHKTLPIRSPPTALS